MKLKDIFAFKDWLLYRQKAAIEQEQSEAGFDSAEREQTRTRLKVGLLVEEAKKNGKFIEI